MHKDALLEGGLPDLIGVMLLDRRQQFDLAHFLPLCKPMPPLLSFDLTLCQGFRAHENILSWT